MNQRNHAVLMGVFPPLSLRGVKSRVPRESNPFFGGTGQTVAEFVGGAGEMARRTSTFSFRFSPVALVVVWNCRWILWQRRFPIFYSFSEPLTATLRIANIYIVSSY
jgi:hypothetical protein